MIPNIYMQPIFHKDCPQIRGVVLGFHISSLLSISFTQSTARLKDKSESIVLSIRHVKPLVSADYLMVIVKKFVKLDLMDHHLCVSVPMEWLLMKTQMSVYSPVIALQVSEGLSKYILHTSSEYLYIYIYINTPLSQFVIIG